MLPPGEGGLRMQAGGQQDLGPRHVLRQLGQDKTRQEGYIIPASLAGTPTILHSSMMWLHLCAWARRC